MRCDGDAKCAIEPMRAPRLVVPHIVRPGQPIEKPRRMMTLMHFCELHRIDLDEKKLARDLLVPKVKADFEAVAKRKWPSGYVCDFERAYVEWMLVTTPEYRAFMAALGYEGVMGAASLGEDHQRFARELMGVRRIAG